MSHLPTESQRRVVEAWEQLRTGGVRLSETPSRHGQAGLIVRRLLLRFTRHLETRQGLLDEHLLRAIDALAFDAAVSHRGFSAFPAPLDPAAVLEVMTRLGPLYMHAADQVMTPSIAANHEWEPEESAFIRSCVRSGDTLLDVGANVGYCSVFCSSLVGASGRVISVEPERRNLSLLTANLWRHECANVVVLPVAAGREPGFLPLQCNEENRGDHQTGLEEHADELVPCARLDDLLAGQRVDFIKVDTQGSDHEVIAGLARTIRSGSPTILCEFWPPGLSRRGVDARAVADSYQTMGFDLQVMDDTGELTPAEPEHLVAAALSHPTGYRNVVLRRRA